MWRFALPVVAIVAIVRGDSFTPKSGDELVSKVLDNCSDMDCVKMNVLGYLDNLLGTPTERKAKNIDMAIFKRAAKVFKTHEFRFKIPEAIMEKTEVVYNPKSGIDVITNDNNEARGLGLKKKLLLPVLLLLKLKMKMLMPILLALVSLKATKALILSKLAILIVIGFIAYQLLGKSGMPMPMSMAPAPPAEPPAPLYGPPSTPVPNSYEPGWEPNQGGPYQRVWSGNNDAHNLAYSAYFPGTSSPTTARP